MLKRIFLTAFLFFGIGIGNVFARGDSITWQHIDKLDELAESPSDGNDFLPVWDVSAKKDKRIDVARLTWTGIEGSFTIGTDTYALSAWTTCTGTVTLAKFTTYVFSNATGTPRDRVWIPDGSTAGQQKRLVLAEDLETAGMVVIPMSEGISGGTSVLLQDQYDSLTFEWTNSVWVLVSNNGGTVQ